MRIDNSLNFYRNSLVMLLRKTTYSEIDFSSLTKVSHIYPLTKKLNLYNSMVRSFNKKDQSKTLIQFL